MYTVCQKETKTTFSFLLSHPSCKYSPQAVGWVCKNYGHTIFMTAGGKHRVRIQMTSVVRSTMHLQRVPVSITSAPLQQFLTGQGERTRFNLLKAGQSTREYTVQEKKNLRQQGWGDLMQKNFSVSDFYDSLTHILQKMSLRNNCVHFFGSNRTIV